MFFVCPTFIGGPDVSSALLMLPYINLIFTRMACKAETENIHWVTVPKCLGHFSGPDE